VPAPRPAVEDPVPHPVPSTRVLLVSPDRLSRLGWSRSLRSRVAGRLQVDEAPSATAAAAMISSTGAPRLVLLDQRADDPGADRLMSVLAGSPGVRVVVVGGTDTVDRVQWALKRGAGGYLFAGSRTQPGAALPAAAAVNWPRVVDKVDVVNCDGAVCWLSRREVEVLEHVANGEPNSAIAHALGLSAFTVKSHLSRIRRRLGTGDRGHMVYLAMRAGVLS
jgi:DNA-binding NarL/FixJ family response regulator